MPILQMKKVGFGEGSCCSGLGPLNLAWDSSTLALYIQNKLTLSLHQLPAIFPGGLERVFSKRNTRSILLPGLSSIAKEPRISRRHINKTALIMISANYEMKVNFMPCLHRQKGSELFKFSSAQ